MKTGLLIIVTGVPIAFAAAFKVVAFVATGEMNPLVSEQQYLHLRGYALLLFYALSVAVFYIAIKAIDREET